MVYVTPVMGAPMGSCTILLSSMLLVCYSIRNSLRQPITLSCGIRRQRPAMVRVMPDGIKKSMLTLPS